MIIGTFRRDISDMYRCELDMAQIARSCLKKLITFFAVLEINLMLDFVLMSKMVVYFLKGWNQPMVQTNVR